MRVIVQGADLRLSVPVQFPVLNLHWENISVKCAVRNIRTIKTSNHLFISSSWSVFIIESSSSGLGIPVQFSILDLDVASSRLSLSY